MTTTRKIILFLSVFLLFTAATFAQVTTSGMSGRVLDANNNPLPGATVLAIHEPSGSQYGTSTNTEGRFNLQGMRTGGPYLVEISFVGYSKESHSNIILYLGEHSR
jgi:hypothetical protein